MRIVIDTNVVVSAMFFGGKPRKLLEMLEDNLVNAYVTDEIVKEYGETTEYLLKKFGGDKMSLPLELIVRKMKLIDAETKVEICRDPDDDKFINCAIDAKCYYIVSGDKNLLDIKQYKDVQILKVADFLEMME